MKLSTIIYILALYKKKQIGLDIKKEIKLLSLKEKTDIKNIKRIISQVEYLETNGFNGIKYSMKIHDIYYTYYNHKIKDLIMISKGLYSIKK